MGPRRQFNRDRVAGRNLAADDDDSHDAGVADEIALRIAIGGRLHQLWLKVIELSAGITQPRDLDDLRIA